MKGFRINGVLIGAHALEIYLKAFLIQKTGTYIKGHDLADYYRKCMELDSFFQDEQLSRYFLPEKQPEALAHNLWGDYIPALRYPECLPGQPKISGVYVESASNTAGTFESLDRVAHFMYKNMSTGKKLTGFVFFPGTGESKEKLQSNVIDDFLCGDGYLWFLGTQENAAELIETFLLNNKYFTIAKL